MPDDLLVSAADLIARSFLRLPGCSRVQGRDGHETGVVDPVAGY